MRGRLTQNRIGSPKGFTLLEIVIVMTLMALVLGLSTVYFAGFLPAAKFSAAGREVSALVRQARSLARMNMEKKTVIIDLDGRVYGIEGLGSKSFPADMKVTVVDPVSGEMTRGKYPLVFQPDGSMQGGSIVLSARGKSMRIETDPISGAVVLR